MGTLNGLFVLGRSIGLIGHHLDQKSTSLFTNITDLCRRLRTNLYRHPWDDISYAVPDIAELAKTGGSESRVEINI